jgi:hypothetical protein
MSLIIAPSSSSTQFNKPVYGFRGEYTLAPAVSVPYLNATLDLERVIKELKTYDQVPPNLAAIWSLEELYQREIDYDRIDREIVNGYLKDAAKLKFFNAITVVLFPKDVKGLISNSFDDYPGNAPTIPVEDYPLDQSFAKAATVSFGGVQYSSLEGFGRLRWDMNRVEAVAVDGQHRLAALRRWHESKQQVMSDFERQTKIPVLFVLLHASAGFKYGNALSGLRSISREIFTDLNKNAKKVDEARELILDDRSLTALCARRLVTPEAARDDKRLLPLSLVRWQEPNVRFDQSYYLNSLLNLHQLVEVTLQLDEPSNPLDKGQAERFVKSLNDALGAGKELSDGVKSLSEYFTEHYIGADEEMERPLKHLPETYLRAAIEQFQALHMPYVLKFVTTLKPYAEVLDYARSNQLITGLFGQWHAQPADHRRQLEDELARDNPHWKLNEIDRHIKAIMEIKYPAGRDTWAFKVIFQKAVLRVIRRIGFEHAAESERLGNTDDVIRILNKLYAKHVLDILYKLPDDALYGLWAFIALTPSTQKIRVSKRVEDDLVSLLALGYFMNRKYEWDRSQGREGVRDPAKLLKYFGSASSGDERPVVLWPGCNGDHSRVLGTLADNAHVWHGNQRVFEGSSVDRVKAKRQRLARQRLALILREFAVTFEAVSLRDEEDDDADSTG